MATDQNFTLEQRKELEHVINHIQHQDREINELREDITASDFEA